MYYRFSSFYLLLEEPEVSIKENQGASGTHFSLDCIVMYKGERVTKDVVWTDGKGTVLSTNSHLEVALKAGANVMRCKYKVGNWAGHKTIVRILRIDGSSEGGSTLSTGGSGELSLKLNTFVKQHFQPSLKHSQ